jgi:hypothetical protein
MKTDTEIRRDVETELQWDPCVQEKKIGVIVSDGVVTLTGEVSHLADKWAAEDVAKRISRVRAIANEIQVKIPLAGVAATRILLRQRQMHCAGTSRRPATKSNRL